MKRLLVIAFLASITAAAQGLFPWPDPAQLALTPVASTASWGSPTNNTDGTLPYAWYVADNYYTNTYVYLPDLYTNAVHHTNKAAAGSWPTGNPSALNGLATLSFDGVDDYLNHGGDFGKGQPTEYVFVFKMGPTADNYDYFYSLDSQRSWTSDGDINLRTSSSVSFQRLSTLSSNTFTIISDLFNGDATERWTNNVLSKQASLLNRAQYGGMTLMVAYGNSQYFGNGTLAEMLIYATNVVGTNAVFRSNLWYYLKSKYSL